MMRKSLLVGAILLAVCSCGVRRGEPSPWKSVLVATPEPLSPGEERHLSGQILSSAEISVAFKTPGQISQIAVREGQHVAKGQVLARLDDSDYLLGVEALEPQYRQLEAEVSRLRQLHSSGGVSTNDLEKAETGLKQLGVQLQVNRNKVEYTVLRAPCAGVVQSVNFQEAEMVDAGTPVFSLLQTGSLTVRASLPLSLAREMDRVVSVEGRAEGRSFPLRLVSIAPKADINQRYAAKFVIDGPEAARLSAGLNVDVLVRLSGLESEAGKYILPSTCVFEKDGESAVWVISGGVVSARRVTLEGLDAGGEAIVSGSLSPADSLVRAGVAALREGQRVTVVREAAGSNVGGLL